MTENFKTLKEANLAGKNDIDDFVKNTDFDEKLLNINKKVASNKTNHIEAAEKLNDHIISYTKLIIDLSE